MYIPTEPHDNITLPLQRADNTGCRMTRRPRSAVPGQYTRRRLVGCAAVNTGCRRTRTNAYTGESAFLALKLRVSDDTFSALRTTDNRIV